MCIVQCAVRSVLCCAVLCCWLMVAAKTAGCRGRASESSASSREHTLCRVYSVYSVDSGHSPKSQATGPVPITVTGGAAQRNGGQCVPGQAAWLRADGGLALPSLIERARRQLPDPCCSQLGALPTLLFHHTRRTSSSAQPRTRSAAAPMPIALLRL